MKSKRQQNADAARIQRIYGQRCSGITIPILKTVDVFKVGEAAIAQGADDAALGDAIAAYVETIRC